MAANWFTASARWRTASTRVFCSGKPDGADAGVLRSGGAGRAQPGRTGPAPWISLEAGFKNSRARRGVRWPLC